MILKFQSLFYWILFFYLEEAIDLMDLPSEFQSLFYWILFFYTAGYFHDNENSDSFNPYSTGFSSFIDDSVIGEEAKYLVSILILLDSLLL